MKLVHVIPIAKGIAKDRLSYFSNQDIALGSIVFVPLRNRTVPALVTELEPLADAKEALRNSSYMVKKITGNKQKMMLLPEFVDSIFAASAYFATSFGALLHQTVPQIFFDEVEKLPEVADIQKQTGRSYESLVFQADEKARFLEYRSLAREAFARDASVFILSPTIRDTEFIAENISKGIEKYVFVLHGEVKKKELMRRAVSLLKLPHPVVIVGTGSFLSVPRRDVDTIVIERENSRSFKMQSRPYTDFRVIAEHYARALPARLIRADLPLSVESLFRYKQKEYDELFGSQLRATHHADQYIIDMRPEEGGSFFAVSSQLEEAVLNAQKAGERTFIFSVRRGLAPTTVCEDCGSVVTCAICHAPVVLHKAKSENVFICHTCGAGRSANERCKVCKSWRLKALGVGATRIKDDFIRIFGEKKVFAIDSDTTKTFAEAERAADAFFRTSGSILVGTERALSFVRKPVAISAIASIDSLLSLPDPKMYEHIFSLILKVRGLADRAFFLQTRQPELSLIREAVNGNIQGFYDTEILNRKRFDYPPFTILIKITVTGTEFEARKAIKDIEERLCDFPFQIYPAFTPVAKGRYALHGLLKIPCKSWPDTKLLSVLRSLPPSVAINVGPESTL